MLLSHKLPGLILAGSLALRLAVAGEGQVAPEAASLEEKARATTLVKQLGSEDYQERIAARDALLKLGAKAREALEAAKESKDHETQIYVAQLLPFIWAAADQRAWQEAMAKAWPEALKEGRLPGPLLGALSIDAAVNSEGALGEEAPLLKQDRGVESGLMWMARAQAVDGHWDARKFGAQRGSDVEQTALALLSFLGAGRTEKVGAYRENVKRAVEWLRSCQREDGAILNPGWTQVDGVAHALAGTALAEAAGMGRMAETIQAAQKAVNYAFELHQCGEGANRSGFGRTAKSSMPDLVTSTFFTMNLKSAKVAGLRVDPAAFQGLIVFLDQVDNARVKQEATFSLVPGGKSTSQATFMGCVARQFLGWKREDLTPYFEKAVKEYPGPSTGEATSDMLINYFGTLAVFQQGGVLWKTWNEKMKKSLVDNQHRDGAATGSWDPSGAWSGAGRVFATAVNCLCLEYCRYLPMYKE